MGWLSILLGLADPIEKITTAIVKARADALNATTEQEKIAAEERVKTLEAQRDLQMSEGKTSRTNMIVRAFAASPVIIVVWKLLVWDKVIGSFLGCSQAPIGTCKIFTTDPLDDNQWKIIGVVYGFYFIYELGLGVTRIIKR
ncbi:MULTISPECIES: hypothetical protein [unclassified Bradyrhizobium]|uniref:hypothetical protein n=1 Tax=unclassified Bradyrhizobium TaxID=2631580 RepID=UPI0024799CB8|nr:MULTISPECIES: hypothetical protein [unclassified Bradyrhizobium]WGR74352.1 hypothetical protein MTX24_16640 [Bradyrhizobium sp. ISRA426]WGR79187.1 hypothetical protein MTX21_01755 [Bradyrhizobium sp. ISRA430]WGR90608.1 hypothetical protein MTX25_39565 [Bradyrhizobium sp. ISRA432]